MLLSNAFSHTCECSGCTCEFVPRWGCAEQLRVQNRGAAVWQRGVARCSPGGSPCVPLGWRCAGCCLCWVLQVSVPLLEKTWSVTSINSLTSLRHLFIAVPALQGSSARAALSDGAVFERRVRFLSCIVAWVGVCANVCPSFCPG